MSEKEEHHGKRKVRQFFHFLIRVVILFLLRYLF